MDQVVQKEGIKEFIVEAIGDIEVFDVAVEEKSLRFFRFLGKKTGTTARSEKKEYEYFDFHVVDAVFVDHSFRE